MHTEYFLLTADVTVQMPVTLIVPAQTCGKSRPAPVRNPSQVETGFDIRGNYSTVSMAVYCIDPSSTFTNGLLSHYFVSEAGINDQNP